MFFLSKHENNAITGL